LEVANDTIKQQIEELLRNIWITRKSRIEASERLINKHNLYQLLIVYYSIVVVSLSIWDIHSTQPVSKSSLALLIASIILSLISMFVTSRNYQERYFNLKNCYIELYELYWELKKMKREDDYNSNLFYQVNQRYNCLLNYVENHTKYDYWRIMLTADQKEREQITKEQASELKRHDVKEKLINTAFFLIPTAILLLILLNPF